MTITQPTMPFLVRRIHSHGHGRAAPPVRFEREVKNLSDVNDMVFAGILYDHSFFVDCG